MTTIIKELTTLGTKFTTEQLEAFKNGLISLTIKQDCRHYREDTVLLYGENNANSEGHFIKKIDTSDYCVYVNDGDNDIDDFNWVNASDFKEITLLVEESYFEEQEKFKVALDNGSPTVLLKLTLAEKANRDDLEQQIKALNAKLAASKGKIDKLDTRVKELFKL